MRLIDFFEENFDILMSLIVLALVVLALSFPLWFPIQGLGATHGEHTGIVTAVEDNTFLYHSVIVYFKTDATSTQEDIYCLNNQSMRPVLEDAAAKRMKVTVSYYSDIVLWKWDCWGAGEIITQMRED